MAENIQILKAWERAWQIVSFRVVERNPLKCGGMSSGFLGKCEGCRGPIDSGENLVTFDLCFDSHTPPKQRATTQILDNLDIYL